MSNKALTWAFDQEIKPSLKFILVALADAADGEFNAWPHIETIVRMTCLNKRTVFAGLDALEAQGFIKDTGIRKGKTGRIKVYNFHDLYKKCVIPVTVQETAPLDLPGIVHVSTPNSAGSCTSPTPPYIEEPLLEPLNKNINTKSTKIKKGAKYTLAEWESINGELSFSHLAPWSEKKGYYQDKIIKAIEDFRTKVTASGKVYANFVAAFQVYLSEGWLIIKPCDLQRKIKMQTFDHGIRP